MASAFTPGGGLRSVSSIFFRPSLSAPPISQKYTALRKRSKGSFKGSTPLSAQYPSNSRQCSVATATRRWTTQ